MMPERRTPDLNFRPGHSILHSQISGLDCRLDYMLGVKKCGSADLDCRLGLHAQTGGILDCRLGLHAWTLALTGALGCRSLNL